MLNWDILCLLRLEPWYKCKIIQSAIFSENIAMGRSISKIFWNGVNWGHWARTICDESFAVLFSHSFWRFFKFFWLISMFWRNSHSKIQKSGAIDFPFTPLLTFLQIWLLSRYSCLYLGSLHPRIFILEF